MNNSPTWRTIAIVSTSAAVAAVVLLLVVIAREPRAATTAEPPAVTSPSATPRAAIAAKPACSLSIIGVRVSMGRSSRFAQQDDVANVWLTIRNDGPDPIIAWKGEVSVLDALGDAAVSRVALRDSSGALEPGASYETPFSAEDNPFIPNQIADNLRAVVGAQLTARFDSCETAR